MLSLMEEPELASVGAPVKVLAEELKGHGVAWHHLPICDLGAPDERFETVWVELWPRLDLLFQNRGRAFIHCYAGLGRTGTVAALILMQYGQSARDALRLVRAARPGSIQSFEQEHYLSLAGQPRAIVGQALDGLRLVQQGVEHRLRNANTLILSHRGAQFLMRLIRRGGQSGQPIRRRQAGRHPAPGPDGA